MGGASNNMSASAVFAPLHQQNPANAARIVARVLSRTPNSGTQKAYRDAWVRLAIQFGFADNPSPWLAVPWDHVTRAQFSLALTLLAEVYAPSTVNFTYKCFRKLIQSLADAGLLSETDYSELRSVPEPKQPTQARRAVRASELARVARVCARDPRPQGARDAALLGCLYLSGLRREQVVALRSEQLTRTQRLIAGQPPVDGGTWRALSSWLEHRGRTPGPLFCRVTKGGRVQPAGLSAGGIYRAIRGRIEEAGLNLTTQDFRQSFVSGGRRIQHLPELPYD